MEILQWAIKTKLFWFKFITALQQRIFYPVIKILRFIEEKFHFPVFFSYLFYRRNNWIFYLNFPIELFLFDHINVIFSYEKIFISKQKYSFNNKNTLFDNKNISFFNKNIPFYGKIGQFYNKNNLDHRNTLYSKLIVIILFNL